MTHKQPPAHAARLWHKLGAVLLTVFLLLPAYAQQVTGSLTVTVTNANGEAVAGAEVTATNQANDQIFKTAMTNDVGVAIIDGLPPGLYTVSVSAIDFKRFQQTDVNVTISQTATIAAKLTPAIKFTALPGEGEVESRRGVERAELQQELSSLPNFNNDLTPLLQIVPGAVTTGSSSLGRVIVDGKGADQQTMRLDGVDFTSQVDFPSADAAINPIGSFQKPEVAGDLDSSVPRSGAFGYPATAGPGSGVVSEVPTFAGPPPSKTARWKAQFYANHRNDAFNARNFFDYDGENAIRSTRFGGKFGTTLGGLQRTGLFLAYDGARGRIERNIYEAVPVVAVTGGAAGSLAPLMRGFLPPGTTVMPGSLNPDFVVARRRARTTIESNAWDARIDYRPFYPGVNAPAEEQDSVEARRQVSFRIMRQTAETHVPDGVTGRSQRQRFNFMNGVVALTWVTSLKDTPSQFEQKRRRKDFSHQLRFGFNQTNARMNAETPSTTATDLAQSLITTAGTVPVTGLPLTPLPEGVNPTIPVATLGGLISGSGRGLDLRPMSYSFIYDYSRDVRDNARSTRWAHELYAGAEARFLRFDYDRLGGLTYAFPSVAALRTGAPGSVTYLSDLSGPSPFSETAGRRHARQQFFMGYFQMVSQSPGSDKPGLGPAVTLTYGLRYDYFSRVRERDNRAVVVDPSTGQMLPAGSPFYREDRVNFQPRFGLTYRLGEGPNTMNTVLRAGVGLYSGVPRIGDLTLPIDSNRFSTGITGGTFPSTPADAIRDFINSPLSRQFQPLAFARDFSPLERSLKWDAKLSHIRNGYEFSAYYIGNMGRNLALANFANRIVSVTTNPDPTQSAIVVREFDIVRNGLVFKPFGEFLYRRGGGHSRYDAMSLAISRDAKADAKNILDPPNDKWTFFKKWFRYPVTSFSAKYTLSRSVGNASGALMSNPLDPDADFGDNAGVPRHNFTLSAAYELWTPKRRNIDALWAGWKISPSLKLTSGLPLNIRITRPDVVYVDAAGNVFGSAAAGRTARLNTLGGGGSAGSYVPNLVSGADPFANNGTELLNPAAFAAPAPGQLGNLRRGQFRGPSIVQLDLVLRRNLFLRKEEAGEKMHGEFQIEINNVFNRANFANPAVALPNVLGTSAADNQLQPGAPFTRAASTFGVITAADPGRLIQLSFILKFKGGFTK